MWHSKSFEGLCMLIKYVTNWYSVLGVYFNVIPSVKARFRDGTEIFIPSRNNYWTFHEEFYKRYLEDKGFIYNKAEKKNIVYTPDGLQFVFLKVPFSYYLNEIFLERMYGGCDLNGRVVIDVGTYLAESAIYFVKQGASKVYGFEPDIENYNQGQENIRLNNMEGKIHIYNEEANYSSIKNLINQYSLKDIFLKIDCEGCEYEILENADCLTFEKITDVVLEYHRQPEPLMQKLIKLGFSVKRKKEIIYSSLKTN